MTVDRWRWLESGDEAGSEQMAIDAGLMDRARDTGESVLRVYGWNRPTLSFGRHESVRDRFAPGELSRHGVDAVRRPTGGRVLLHEGDATYSVTSPASDAESVHAAFARINGLLMAALARLGVPVSEAPKGRALRPGRDACFAEPSAGELVVDGRKLVASAQRRDSGALLQHGSILISDRQGRIPALSTVEMPAPAPGATLESVLGRVVPRAEVRAALRAALEEAVGSVNLLDSDEVRDYAHPHRALFSSSEWTWRR